MFFSASKSSGFVNLPAGRFLAGPQPKCVTCRAPLVRPPSVFLGAPLGQCLESRQLTQTTQDAVFNGQGALNLQAMRHGDRLKKLNRPADQRKALLRALTTELLRHGRIKTTVVRAKVVRQFADRMITLAKNGSLAARRRALGFIYDKQLVHALFEAAPERYGARNGGYTRIIRTDPRRGDNAEMAFIELV